MSNYTSIRLRLIIVLLLLTVPSSKSRRNRDDDESDFEGIVQCIDFLACQCGGAVEVQYFKECMLELKAKTQEWAINAYDHPEICPELNGVLEFGTDIIENIRHICTLEPETRTVCDSKFGEEFRIYYRNLSMSVWPEDLEESYAIFKAFDCLAPCILRCQSLPGTCMPN